MASLPSLAFAFARFVAREHRRPWFTRRNFGLAAAHRQSFGPAAATRRRNFGRNFGRHHQRRLNRNGGLRHRRAPLVAPRRRYGPGAGLRRRHNHGHHRGHRWVQREAAAAMPEAVHEAVAGATEVAAVPETVAISPLVAAPVATATEREDEAAASNISADVDDLLPPPPAFTVPPIKWLLGGPSAGWLMDEPERNFSDEEDEATPPLQYYLRHGYGPCLPSPTPSDEDSAHFAPPGYAPVPEFSFSSAMVRNQEKIEDATPAAARSGVPDLNLPAQDVEEEKNEDAPHTPNLPTASPEARVLLRRLASSMAARPASIRRGTWSPEALGLSGRVAELRLDEPAHYSFSAEGSSRR